MQFGGHRITDLFSVFPGPLVSWENEHSLHRFITSDGIYLALGKGGSKTLDRKQVFEKGQSIFSFNPGGFLPPTGKQMVRKEGRVSICFQSQAFLVRTFTATRFSSHMASLRVFSAKKKHVLVHPISYKAKMHHICHSRGSSSEAGKKC